MSKTREISNGKVTDSSKPPEKRSFPEPASELNFQKSAPPANVTLLTERLFDAISNRDKPAIERLIAGGADVNFERIEFGKHYDCPLMVAVETGDLSIVRLLVENGADVNLDIGSKEIPNLHLKAENRRALTTAAVHGSAEIINYLIEQGAETNLRYGKEQMSLLSLAALGGNIDGIRIFLKLGAKLNEKDGNGMTALQHAAYHCRIEAMKELISCGAREDGNSIDRVVGVYSMAICNNEDKGLVPIQLLIDLGADCTEALWQAAQSHAPKILRLLLKGGANVNVKVADGSTPIFWAAESMMNRRENESVDQYRARRTETIRLLYSYGAKLDAVDWGRVAHFDRSPKYPKAEHIIITALCNSGIPSVEELELHLIAGANIYQVHREGSEKLFYLDGYVQPFQSEYRRFFQDHGAKI
jgi:ankyrin repeat protein